MINLLPPETKSQLSAARANWILLRYNIIMLGALGFLILAVIIVFLYLNNTKAVAEQNIAYNRSKVSDYASVESEANTFRQNLTNAKQILDSDTAYTKVILEIAGVLPSGIVLDTLSLDPATFGSPTTLTARAKSYDATLALKDALQHSSLFSNVSIQSLSNSNDGTYPIVVTLSVTLKKDAVK